MTVTVDPLLEMGIYADDGTVWLPKEFHPERNGAKMWAVDNLDLVYLDIRVRTRWMVFSPEWAGDDQPYHVCGKDHIGAFECWEIG